MKEFAKFLDENFDELSVEEASELINNVINTDFSDFDDLEEHVLFLTKILNKFAELDPESDQLSDFAVEVKLVIVKHSDNKALEVAYDAFIYKYALDIFGEFFTNGFPTAAYTSKNYVKNTKLVVEDCINSFDNVCDFLNSDNIKAIVNFLA